MSEEQSKSEKRYSLELIVRANTWSEAVDLLKTIHIDEKVRKTKRAINGYYIVGIEKAEAELGNDFYEKIRKSKAAVLSDSLSKEREQLIVGYAYEVEIELRKLLLHVLDLIEPFLDIVWLNMKHKNSRYTPKDTILSEEHVDPITANLSFGELVGLLQYDLSTYWNERGLTPEVLLDLLERSEDFEGLKKLIQERQEHVTIWDIVNDNVLEVRCDLGHVSGQLYKLIELRDKAAHHNLISAEDVKNAKNYNQHIITTISKSKKLTQADKNNIKDLSSIYSRSISSALETLRNYSAHQTLQDAIESIQLNSLPNIDFHSYSSELALSRALETLRNQNTHTLQQALETIKNNIRYSSAAGGPSLVPKDSKEFNRDRE